MSAVKQKLSVSWKLRNLSSPYKQFRIMFAAGQCRRWDVVVRVCTVTSGISICVTHVATNINTGT
jgi:hypothetical protein